MAQVIAAGAGQTLQVLQDTLQLKLRSQASVNGMSVMEVCLPPGSLVPPHSHDAAEEGYYVLEGAMQMFLDTAEHAVRAGDFIHVPPGHLHGYRNHTDQACRLLAWTIGGAMDAFFLDMSATVRQLPQDLAQLPAVLARHAVHMPPPPQA